MDVFFVPEDPVVIENGTFSWTKEEEPTLVNLNFRVKEGSLVAVVGQVGAGKSSLLSALLGEMVKWNGHVNVKVRSLSPHFSKVISLVFSQLKKLNFYMLFLTEKTCCNLHPPTPP